MRPLHKANEKLFIDDCARTGEVIDQRDCEVRHAQVFVILLGASS